MSSPLTSLSSLEDTHDRMQNDAASLETEDYQVAQVRIPPFIFHTIYRKSLLDVVQLTFRSDYALEEADRCQRAN
jgi:hypothetical protein